MNEGARQANADARHYSERLHRESQQAHQRRVEQLLREIRDLLKWHFRDDPMAGAASPQEEP